MAKEKDIRITKIGGQKVMQIRSDGRRYNVPLFSQRKKLPSKPKRISPGDAKLQKLVSTSIVQTVEGGIDADNARPLDLTKLISHCKTATNKEYFSLAMGIAGQMKVITHFERNNSVDMKIAFKIADGDPTQQFVSSSAPKTLLLFCDGVYWYPIGEFTGTSDVGEWSMT